MTVILVLTSFDFSFSLFFLGMIATASLHGTTFWCSKLSLLFYTIIVSIFNQPKKKPHKKFDAIIYKKIMQSNFILIMFLRSIIILTNISISITKPSHPSPPSKMNIHLSPIIVWLMQSNQVLLYRKIFLKNLNYLFHLEQ